MAFAFLVDESKDIVAIGVAEGVGIERGGQVADEGFGEFELFG